MTDELKQVYTTPDGSQFDTKAEAMDHLRRPKIEKALMALTEDNADLTTWLMDNQDVVEAAFDTGTIKRVTKSERKKLSAALEYAASLDDKKLAFLVDNADAINDTFRWPTVKRMNDEEKAIAAKASLMAASDNNEDLANWTIENKDNILEAYEAGKVKRKVSEKATKALEEYRAKKAAEKAAKEKSEKAA
jgi:succinate dehydrogenase flavin-adding protein (antitoxin of CptAB toxin-antitoxin module)